MNHEPRTTGTKVCSHCKQEKHVLAFSARAPSSDGLNQWCRDCVGSQNHRRIRRQGTLGKNATRKAEMARTVCEP